jgi:class 3 adenylate cyclase
MALVEAAKLQLAKFVPDIVRREIEANPQAPGIDARPRDVTVLFLDIAGYTNLNERLSPQEAQKLIERSFSRLLDSIYKWGGEICESTGDGLIVFFSSDDAVEHACDAASSAAAMREEVRNLNVDLGGESVRVVVNFGLNSGIGAVGSTRLEGASRSRWIYTVNGQVVNIAARIVGEAKDGAILVGPETQRRIQGRFATRSVGRRRLKGISVDVELFAVDAARPAPDRRPVDQADAGS